PRAPPRPLPAPALRRRAPARRRRPRARGEAQHRADGRAVRRPRSHQPRRHRPGLSPSARRSRPHHGDDHPRHARSGAARRPGRRHAGRPPDRRRFAARADERPARRLRGRTDPDPAPPGRAPARPGRARAFVVSGVIADALALLPGYLGSHVLVSVTALALGLVVSLPLAILSVPRPALRATLLAITSIVQTIPGLALLALFYPLLLGVAMLTERAIGLRFSALGFLPSVLALALYSMLPVLRNTVTGLMGVDAAVKQAAVGVGMTPRQSLWMVELPLALPVIMAGIRTS